MLILLIPIGLVLLVLAGIPYAIYFFGAKFGDKTMRPIRDVKGLKKIIVTSSAKSSKHTGELLTKDLPDVSIVICAYNEERVLGKKLNNLLRCSYPLKKLEVVVMNDGSTDKTEAVARGALEKIPVKWKIITNDPRLGKNRSMNKGMAHTSCDLVITTDADVICERNAFELLIRKLISDDSLAAVTGNQLPVRSMNVTTRLEKTYRSFFSRMCEWECAYDSTYNFNGNLIAVKKKLMTDIPEHYGADDANTAFVAIRQGYRTSYVSDAFVYEEIPKTMKLQYIQKARRAKRLIQATLKNRDLMRSARPFARVFYPLRVWMYVVSPTLFFVGGVVFVFGLALNWPWVLVLPIMVLVYLFMLMIRRGELVSAFLLNQFYLFAGLWFARRNPVLWESTSEKKMD